MLKWSPRLLYLFLKTKFIHESRCALIRNAFKKYKLRRSVNFYSGGGGCLVVCVSRAVLSAAALIGFLIGFVCMSL